MWDEQNFWKLMALENIFGFPPAKSSLNLPIIILQLVVRRPGRVGSVLLYRNDLERCLS
jgi:hypothetical protein